MDSTSKMEMQEDADGSAIINLPDDEVNPQVEVTSTDPVELSDGGSVNDDDGGEDDDTDEEREAIRAARREERRLKKEIHKTKARESNHLINALKKQNSELANRLANLETRTNGAELARVDKVIDDTAVQVEYAKMKMREAVSAQDGDSLVRAQELLYESQRKLESLRSIKDNATKQMSAPKQNINVPDASVQRMASDWMSRNKWYDPYARDVDSRVAKSVDEALTEEGFDPTTEDYWDELDERLQKYLPHQYAQPKQTQRPRGVVTGSGRESAPTTKANEFRLSADRVRALKDAGMWDDVEKRNKMIKQFASFDRSNKGAK